MELRVMEYFLALAQEGSVSAAAEALHVSQPTLSRQLMDLERELGTTLFTRSRKGITLTEDGMLLRRRASEIVNLTRVAQSEIMLNRGTIAGEIRIGCAETKAMDLLSAVMLDFQRDHPQVSFIISSDLAENTVEKIDRGLLDFGLLLRLNDSWGLDAVRLPSKEQIVVITQEDSPLAKREVVELDDLASIPMLIPSSFRESGILGDELPRSEGGRLDVVAEFGLPYNASRMVRAGMGSAVTLEGLIETPPGSGLTTRPLALELDMPTYLAWRPFHTRTHACEAFLERARKAFSLGGGLIAAGLHHVRAFEITAGALEVEGVVYMRRRPGDAISGTEDPFQELKPADRMVNDALSVLVVAVCMRHLISYTSGEIFLAGMVFRWLLATITPAKRACCHRDLKATIIVWPCPHGGCPMCKTIGWGGQPMQCGRMP